MSARTLDSVGHTHTIGGFFPLLVAAIAEISFSCSLDAFHGGKPKHAHAQFHNIPQFPECHFCIYLLLVRVAVLHLQLHNTPNVIPFSLLRGKLCPSCASAGNTWAAKSMALQRRTRGAIPWPQF